MLFLFNPMIEVSFQGCQTLTTVLGITLLAHLFIFDFVFVFFVFCAQERSCRKKGGKEKLSVSSTKALPPFTLHSSLYALVPLVRTNNYRRHLFQHQCTITGNPA